MRTTSCAVGAAFIAFASAACHETATAPKPSAPIVSVASSLVANGPVLQTAAPATVAITAPEVVVRDQAGEPMSGVAVTFSVVDGGGAVAETQVTSDVAGVASSGAWRLGPTAGQNTLRASVAGLGAVTPVFFTAIGLALPVDNSTYNLTTMGVTLLPVTQCCNYYSLYVGPRGGPADTTSYTTIAGRYVLTSDSTFTMLYLVAVPDSTGVFHVDSTRSLTHGAYYRVGSSTIHFFAGGNLLATGSLSGDVLSISLEEALPGYYDETYVRSRPATNARRSP